MSEEVSFDFEKRVYWSINSIDSFHKERAYRIINNEFTINNSITTITKEENEGFVCKIFLEKLHDHTFNQNIERFGIFEPIIFESTGVKYFACKKSAHSINLTLSSPQVITLILSNFQSGFTSDFNNKIQRLIIPVEKEPTFDIIDFNSVKVNDCITYCGLIKISIEGFNYHLYKYKNEDTGKKYLIIDGQEKNLFQDFKKNCNSIITAFGFLSGNLYQDEYYYQTFKGDDFELVENILYEKKEKSALTEHSLFNPFRFREYLEAFGNKEQLKNTPSRMSTSVFSNLCHIVKTNETYARCCQLIIEGNQSKQILLRAGIYSIALETLTNIIYEENEEKINPITDKKLAKLICVYIQKSIDPLLRNN
jgi:hypothetical protein